ncbi:MAG: hypothetical protein MJY76_00005 [Bacteroidales bacterium]|nr:hypothetical protein [Bacteroidales bacterium]
MSIRRTTITVTTASRCVQSQRQSDSGLLADIFYAYFQARSNKRNTHSQVRFERDLSRNLVSLYEEVRDRAYRPERSMCFIIRDPVQREVFAASFRDRIIHHYLYNQLEPVFEPAFIYDSYSCRKGKGTLFGIQRLEHHIRSCSYNYHRQCFALKLDIEGYFMNMDRNLLFNIILSRIDTLAASGRLPEGFDYDTVVFLLRQIVFLDPTKGCRIKGHLSDWRGLPDSKSLFKSAPGCGLPIGNLTSQLFSNVYLNELDQYVKRELGFHHYGRYVDDFYLVDISSERLEAAVPLIGDFLTGQLHLKLNYRKVKMFPVESGVPFLGAQVCPNGRFLSRRNLKRMKNKSLESLCRERNPYALRATMNSYSGYLGHFCVAGFVR